MLLIPGIVKLWYAIFLFLVYSCQSPQTANNPPEPSRATPAHVAPPFYDIPAERNWKGVTGTDIPVFIHYAIDSNIIVGSITYLDTAQRVSITLLGKIDKDKSYRLLEFDKTVNISGIITGNSSGGSLSGCVEDGGGGGWV